MHDSGQRGFNTGRIKRCQILDSMQHSACSTTAAPVGAVMSTRPPTIDQLWYSRDAARDRWISQST